jgi:putative peptidoglycan lipid II flippase
VPHVLLATSTCIGAALNTTMLWRGLQRAGVLQPAGDWGRFLLRVVLANAAMGALLVWLAGDLASWIALPAYARVLRLAGGVVAGALVYFAVLFAAGLRYRDLRSAVL